MPILDTERPVAPRSALRYRPTKTDQAGPAPVVSRRSRPDALTTTANVVPDELDEEEYLSHPPRRTPRPRARRPLHPLFWLGTGALTLLLLWIGLSQLVTWVGSVWDDWHYGYPRIAQADSVLGIGDDAAHQSHLLALNLSGQIIVEVFPAGDVSRMKAYVLTTLAGQGSDRDVVSLRLIDPSHAGKPAIVVTVGENVSLLVNDGQGGFRPPTFEERRQLLLYLQQAGQ